MNPENYCVPGWHRLLGQTTKQPLSNLEAQKPWKYKQLWGLKPDLRKCYCEKIALIVMFSFQCELAWNKLN